MFMLLPSADFLSALGLPVAAVTLLYRDGFFVQHLDERGTQIEEPVHWDPADQLEELDQRVSVTIDGRSVQLGAFLSPAGQNSLVEQGITIALWKQT